MGSLLNFIPYFLPALIQSLQNKGIIAYPALYSSGIQMTRDFESKEAVNFFLGQEFPEQRKYLTLIPVIFDAEVMKHSLMLENEVAIQFKLELYCQDAQGKLGKRLFARDFFFRIQTQGSQAEWSDLVRTLPAIETEIVSLDVWDSVSLALPDLSKGFAIAFHPKPDSGKNPESERRYFAQSEIITNTHSDQNQLSKADFICTGNETRNLKDINFPFMANDKWPSLLYAYILKPDRSVIRIDLGEAHVEQSPGAMPSKIYDWSRYLVVNLPGLVPHSIVTYAVNFQRQILPEVVPKVGKKIAPEILRLGKDIPVFSSEGEPFQIRVWSEAGDTIKFMPHDALLGVATSLPVQSQTLSFVSGSGMAAPKENDAFTSSNPFHPIVRLSNVKSWKELLANTQDSVFSRLPPEPVQGRVAHKREAEEETLLRFHRFIQDSLRYVSLSFGERTYVPTFPDSVLKQKMGDCKDFSVLLISWLRKAGIPAFPVLVHSSYSRNLFEGPPSFDASNHMIVYIPDHNWWVDPTGPAHSPGILPYYLSGSQGLVLFGDSIVVRNLPVNSDSVYIKKVSIHCKEEGENLNCRWNAVYSSDDSWTWRAYLKDQPQEKWAKLLYPQGWSGAFRILDTGTKVLNFESERENLKIERVFTAYKAVIRVNGKSIIRFPETPFSWVFRYADEEGEKEPPTILEPIIQTVDFTLDSDKPIAWPSFSNFEKGDMQLILSRPNVRTVRVFMRIPARTLQTKDREWMNEILQKYKDFFASSIIAG